MADALNALSESLSRPRRGELRLPLLGVGRPGLMETVGLVEPARRPPGRDAPPRFPTTAEQACLRPPRPRRSLRRQPSTRPEVTGHDPPHGCRSPTNVHSGKRLREHRYLANTATSAPVRRCACPTGGDAVVTGVARSRVRPRHDAGGVPIIDSDAIPATDLTLLATAPDHRGRIAVRHLAADERVVPVSVAGAVAVIARRYLRARAIRRAGLRARADLEHQLAMTGDPRGIYGRFPPAAGRLVPRPGPRAADSLLRRRLLDRSHAAR